MSTKYWYKSPNIYTDGVGYDWFLSGWEWDTRKKPNHNAPKSIKGDYDLSIHGNKIVLVDNVDGTTVEAKCHPDDNFDIGVGIKEAFKKLNEKREEIRKQKEEEEKKIKVGDWVEVVEDDSYDVYLSWAYKNLNFVHVKEFAYEEVPSIGTKARVVKVAPHSNFSSILLYAIETKNNKVYIVEEGWIKKVVKQNV